MTTISSPSKASSWIKEFNRVSSELENIMIESKRAPNGHTVLKMSLETFKALQSKAKPTIEHLSTISMEKYNHIRSIEEDTHDRFSHIVDEYNEVNEKVTAFQKSFASSSESLNNLNEQLTNVRKEHEEVKRQIKAKTDSMVDNTPVLKVKATLKAIKEEIRVMDLEIGILEHSLLHRNVNLTK
jgi:chromosome segregation ATPase